MRHWPDARPSPASTRDYVAAIQGQLRDGRSAPRAPVSVVNHNTVTTGDIQIQTRATDGRQTAIDFMAEMRKRDLLVQTDSGMIP